MLCRVELGKRPLVKTAATLFQDMCYQNKDRLMAGIIVGGWDAKEGGRCWRDCFVQATELTLVASFVCAACTTFRWAAR